MKQNNLLSYVPLDVYILITRACNFDCRYCIRNYPAQLPKDMTISLFHSLLSSLDGLSIRKIVITGGEPLLHPHLVEMVRLATAYYETVICTNGWLLQDRLSKILPDISPKLRFQISLDAVGDQQDEIAGTPGAFERIIQAIMFANDKGIAPSIATTVGHGNIEGIWDIFKTIRRFHICVWQISAEMPCPQSSGINAMVDADAWNVLCGKLNAARDLCGINRIMCRPMFGILRAREHKPLSDLSTMLAGCGAGKTKVYFYTDGSISLCPLLDRYTVFEPQDSFSFWWQSSQELKAFRQFPLKRLDECAECDWLEVCKGGCHGLSLETHGSIYRADPRCPRVKSILGGGKEKERHI